MTSEPMTPEQLAAALSAITCAQIEAPEDADSVLAGLAAGDLLYAEVKRLRCTDSIECGHEAALGQANEQLAAVWALVEPWRSADFISPDKQNLVYRLLAIRDRADLAASSPTEEKG